MPNKNILVTGDRSSTIKNLDEYMRFLCIAAEDDDVCSEGFSHALKTAHDAIRWLNHPSAEKG
ncbi:hypothetical protein [Photobacterium leiognathi]|uniref:hypothetical protein n=1 Tax=Photobacterium leiognathi TaxID=553611 RepID=UPI000D16466E|nr:hypothetical protein [Photobacterium leiognathi]PSW53060.1 hypothetical protein C0W50_19825 [Photobacterium leiognathi subsp. mandapamensis]